MATIVARSNTCCLKTALQDLDKSVSWKSTSIEAEKRRGGWSWISSYKACKSCNGAVAVPSTSTRDEDINALIHLIPFLDFLPLSKGPARFMEISPLRFKDYYNLIAIRSIPGNISEILYRIFLAIKSILGSSRRIIYKSFNLLSKIPTSSAHSYSRILSVLD